jgi:hypothetical protein
MTTLALLMAGAFAFGHGPAIDHKPFSASRANAIVEAAKGPAAKAPPPEATTVRYPSADGDILAGLGKGMVVPPLRPARPIAAAFPPPRAPSATGSGVDASGLLGGPRQ